MVVYKYTEISHRHMKMTQKTDLKIAENISDLPDLISDSDGVITDLSSTYHEYMLEVHGHKAVVNEPSFFSFKDAYPNLEKPHQYIPDFVNDPYWFAKISVYPDAKIALQKLHQAGKKITIVTSCGDSKETMRARLECYERELGNIVSDVIFQPLAKCKSDTLSGMPKSEFFDDLESVCNEVSAHGHDVYMRQRNYNINVCPLRDFGGNFKIAKSWSDLPYFD